MTRTGKQRTLNWDLGILVGGLAATVALIVATVCFPVYPLPGGRYERRAVWDAPTIKVGHGEDLLSDEDRERLMKDPRQREILERMEAMPGEIPIRPIWIGARSGPGRNPLGYTAFLVTLAYVGWLVYKFRP